jgi:inner membrane protein
MDGLTHSLVGLTSAKAGLERWSPYATVVCILSANAPDIDVISGFFGGRWTLLHYHRGITHSIIGTLALGFLIPSILYAADRAIAQRRKRPPQIRYRGLLMASLIAAGTHPLMDWTNNYGVRPLLPWSGKWFYGDLVFIIDPYIWLVLGGAAFLLTSNRRLKIVGWSVLGIAATLLILVGPAQRGLTSTVVSVVRVIWVLGLLAFILARSFNLQQRLRKSIAFAALTFVVCYWGALALMHHAAYENAFTRAEQLAAKNGELLLRVAAMPTAANPLRWQSVAETDRAIYRFFVGVATQPSTSPERYEKPSGLSDQVVSAASLDPRAQVLLGFARFPLARVESENCIGQTLVQFADLRYTEPGGSRGNFSLNVPVECPAR